MINPLPDATDIREGALFILVCAWDWLGTSPS